MTTAASSRVPTMTFLLPMRSPRREKIAINTTLIHPAMEHQLIIAAASKPRLAARAGITVLDIPAGPKQVPMK